MLGKGPNYIAKRNPAVIGDRCGEKEGVKFNEEQYQKSLPLIKTQLKALIARDLWDMNEYFRVMNTTNESVQKALEILNSEEYQKKLRAN